MAAVADYYNHIFFDLADPRTKEWPLMSSPFVPLGIIAIYLITIYGVLPLYMNNRKPFKIKNVIAGYNIFQVVTCASLIYGISTSGWTTHYTLGCQECDFSEDKMAVRMASYIWWTMMLKLAELIETVFFVLRKKYNQVSVLHVYHHASTFGIIWLGVKFYPGGMVTFSILLNCVIHILMYSYYYLTSYGLEMQKKLETLKPKLTAAQIIQLCILFVHTLQVFSPSCSIHNIMGYIFLPNILINMYFFLKFYVANYIKRKTI